MKLKTLSICLGFIFAVFISIHGQSQNNGLTRIQVDVSKTGPIIASSMYGIFFEEISHSGDGSLYAELIQNRGFEDNTVPGGTTLENGFAVASAKPNYRSGQIKNFKVPWNLSTQWPAWSLKQQGTSNAVMNLTKEQPLNSATPQSMQIDISKATSKEPVELANEGYWGVGVKQGEKYNLRFYLHTNSDYKGNVIAKLISAEGKELSSTLLPLKKSGVWNEYKSQITSSGMDAKASFVLSFNSPGTVWVDYVSLFPDKTFKNRKNGLRSDVAQLLADMKPAFIRWPGGCIVEGLTLSNRVNWKEGIGDPVSRPGQYDLWGYRATYGFGFYENLQFCEDIGAKSMFVANIGVSCSVRNGDYCTPEEVSNFVQDALDAIEFAIGDVKTTWGAKRAAMGHPASFPLQYVEVGNEDAGVEIYNERYNIFHKAISEKYPQITIISNHGLNDNIQSVEKLDMIDPHWYVSPDWFYGRANTLFDEMKPRPKYKAYVGEYAANRNVGAGNLNGALSEAAFLIGAERNSDFVTMTSYAPLIENSNKRDWPTNMIWVKSNQSLGRSSYYIQKVFAENRPDINLNITMPEPTANLIKDPYKGFIGLSTNSAQITVQDLSFSSNGSTTSIDFTNWKANDGTWVVNDNTYAQTDTAAVRHMSFLKDKSFANGTLEFKVQKAGRAIPVVAANAPNQRNFRGFGNSFSFIFGATDENNYYQLSFSGRGVYVDKMVNGTSQFVTDVTRFTFEDEKPYAVKLVTNNDILECFIDGVSIIKYKYVSGIKHYAIAGLDEKNNEVVIKVVNAESTPFKTSINLTGGGVINPVGEQITLSSESITDENSFEQPLKISPKKETYKSFSNDFVYEFKPNSLTVLRIKKS
jgi:alpha-L-arabinofuranosidase